MATMRSAPALIHNFVVDNAALTQVPYADIAALNASGVPEFENDAYGHWIFDTGDTAGLTDHVNGRVLTLETTGAYAWGANYWSGVGTGNCLVSDLLDRDDWTASLVMKYPSAGVVAAQTYAGGGGGGAGLFVGAGSGGEAISVVDGPSVPILSLDTVTTPTVGSWVTASMSLDYTTGRARHLRLGDSTISKLDDSADKTLSGRLLAFGNRYAVGAPYSTSTITIAEIVIRNRALSVVEQAAERARAKVRMARRGIAVV